jgi:hypothetical protein
MSFRAFLNLTPAEPWGRIPGSILQWVRNGKMNVVQEVTLTAGALTVLEDELIGPDSLVVLTAKDAAGAALDVWVNGYDYRTCDINHDVAAGTEVFRYAVLG